VASTAVAARQTTPGVTAHTITIGGTFPLTGPAASYKVIAAAEKAYYNYVNDNGGVKGRTIVDKIVDDGYDPSQTVPAVKDLVENQGVFGIVGSLGTAPGLSTMNYLNSKAVPQVLLATGDAYWGLCRPQQNFKPVPGVCPKPKPWTFGWQPAYTGEAKLYAKYMLNHKASPSVGIFYQNDAYGLNYISGFKKGLGKANQGDILTFGPNHDPGVNYDAQNESFNDTLSKLGQLKAAGANVLCIFGTPTPTIHALIALHALNWSPMVFINNVSANRVYLLAAENSGATPDGFISTTYVKSQTNTPNDSGINLARSIIHTYNDASFGGPGALDSTFNSGNSNLIYGLGVAYTFVDALNHAGANPTRASFMSAMKSLQEGGAKANPFLYPGISVVTNPTRTFPTNQLQFIKWDGTAHDWNPFDSVVTSGH
jgi:branched-chain amino acid transport system substrate-binding protein